MELRKFIYKLCTERIQVPRVTTKLNIPRLLKSIVTNRSLIGVLIVAIMLLLSDLGMQGMAAYVFPVAYNSAEAQSLSNLFSNLAIVFICVPIAGKIAARFGKKELGIACLIIKPEDVNVYLTFFVLVFVLFNLFNTVFFAMIFDVIDEAELKNGSREDGTYYSVYSFARKLGMAFSSGMVGAILSGIGYNSVVAANPTAYPQVLEGIFNWSCIVPVLCFCVMALVLIFIYPLNKKRVSNNALALKEKNQL